MTQSHMKEIYSGRRGRKGRKERGEQQGDECLGFLDLREAEELCDGWIPGTPGFISQFQRK